MARIPYNRVRHTPPYVSRSAADRALATTADRPGAVLLVFGEGERHGASRTLKVFVDNAPGMRFLGGKHRYPIVHDLLPGALLPLAENLVQVRNLVVRTFNRAFGVTSIGAHLFEFDALYALWKRTANLEEEFATPLEQTTRAIVGVALRRILVTFAGVGVIEMLGPAKAIAEVARDMGWGDPGWGPTAAIDAARERGADIVVERRVGDVQDFMHRRILPMISRKLRAAKAQDQLTENDIALLMHDVLIESLARAQAAIKDKGILLIAADAIDAVEDEDDNSQFIRFSITDLMLNCGRHGIPTVLCGRAPATPWVEELANQKWKSEPLGKLHKTHIEAGLRAAKLDPSTVELVMRQFIDADDVVAGDYDRACRRLVIDWPRVQ